ncbi:fluoride efflux transporter FluC [Cryptosporangium phraense]|uniref:Fluoride-specific ion channel FluC n=1 Tax=Cryptosporangium phraense TaxID=2593070 RepID=A0A545ANQ4_9ACTN|nr:CrcB family protein [Cryptosporangium phraense]TQS42881.1 CrcB family protein [Cryptosporangium phraense]
MTVLLVALGAAVGAPLRYLTDRAVQAIVGPGYPWGTFGVNVTGSLILGFVAAWPASTAVAALVGTGFCGALTTYSTFSFEVLRLTQQRLRFLAVAYAGATVLAGFGAAAIGLILARAIHQL